MPKPQNDSYALAELARMCRSFDAEFLLRDVVARMLQERPELILDFADAWEELIRTKRVRVRQKGRPCSYFFSEG